MAVDINTLPVCSIDWPSPPTDDGTNADSYDFWLCSASDPGQDPPDPRDPPDPAWLCAIADQPGTVESRKDGSHHVREPLYTLADSVSDVDVVLPGIKPINSSGFCIQLTGAGDYSTYPDLYNTDDAAAFSKNYICQVTAYKVESGVLTLLTGSPARQYLTGTVSRVGAASGGLAVLQGQFLTCTGFSNYKSRQLYNQYLLTVAISGNVLTVTTSSNLVVAAPCTYPVGTVLQLNNYGTPALPDYLAGQWVTITGVSGNTFTAAFTHADLVATTVHARGDWGTFLTYSTTLPDTGGWAVGGANLMPTVENLYCRGNVSQASLNLETGALHMEMAQPWDSGTNYRLAIPGETDLYDDYSVYGRAVSYGGVIYRAQDNDAWKSTIAYGSSNWVDYEGRAYWTSYSVPAGYVPTAHPDYWTPGPYVNDPPDAGLAISGSADSGYWNVQEFSSPLPCRAGVGLNGTWSSRGADFGDFVIPWTGTDALAAGTDKASVALTPLTYDVNFGGYKFGGSDWLACRNFGFNIPSGAVIRRVSFAWEGSVDAAPGYMDASRTSGWAAIVDSTGSGAAANLIDKSDSTAWASASGYPHFATINLGWYQYFSKLRYTPSTGAPTDIPTTGEIWVSDNNSAWTKVCDITFDDAHKVVGQSYYEFIFAEQYHRYAKLVGVTGATTVMGAGEVNLYRATDPTWLTGTMNLGLLVGNQLASTIFTDPGESLGGKYYGDPYDMYWGPVEEYWPGSDTADGTHAFGGSDYWVERYGSSGGVDQETWMLSLTPAQVNDPGFGFTLAAGLDGDPRLGVTGVTANVYSTRMAVYYTAPEEPLDITIEDVASVLALGSAGSALASANFGEMATRRARDGEGGSAGSQNQDGIIRVFGSGWVESEAIGVDVNSSGHPRSHRTQAMLNYFDDSDRRVRENPVTLDAQLLDTACVPMDNLELKLERERVAGGLRFNAAHLDNHGVWWSVALPTNYLLPEASVPPSVLLRQGVHVFPLRQYDDQRPLPVWAELDQDRQPVALPVPVLFDLEGQGDNSQYRWKLWTLSPGVLAMPNRLSFWLEGMGTSNSLVNVHIEGERYPRSAWTNERRRSDETVLAVRDGALETVHVWSSIDRLTVRNLPVGARLRCWILPVNMPAVPDHLRPYSDPSYRDAALDRYWQLEDGRLVERYLKDNYSGLTYIQNRQAPEKAACLTLEPLSWGMLVGADNQVYYLDRREPWAEDLEATGLTQEPAWVINASYNEERSHLGVRHVDVEPWQQRPSQALRYRWLIEGPEGIFVGDQQGRLQTFTPYGGWISGRPSKVTFGLPSSGTYTFSLESQADNEPPAADRFPYANLESVSLARVDVSSLVASVRGLAYDFVSRLWLWDGYYAVPVRLHYNAFVLNREQRRLYVSEPADEVRIS